MLKKEIRDIKISIDNHYNITFPFLTKGMYTIRVIHQCDLLYKHPKSLFMSYSIEEKSDNEIKDILGLKALSEKYGVFSYLGGGLQVKNYYLQEISLNITSDITNFGVQLRTFSRQTNGSIAAIQIYNSTYSKYDLFGFLSPEENLFFLNETISNTISNHISKVAESKLDLMIFLDDNHNDFIDNTDFFNYAMRNEDVALLYSHEVFESHVIDHIKKFFPNAIFTTRLDFSIDRKLNSEQKKELLRIFNRVLENNKCLFTQGIELFGGGILDEPSDLRLISFTEEEFNNYLFRKITLNKDRYVQLDSFIEKISVTEGVIVKLSFSIVNDKKSEVNNSALVIIKYIGEDGSFILPPDDFGINPILGTYQYVSSGSVDNSVVNNIDIKIPKNSGVKYIVLEFKSWGKERIENYLDISTFEIINYSSEVNISKADQFLEKLSAKDKVILIYTTAPYIGHETLELRPNRLTKEYMKLGYKVIFFAFSRVPEELEYPNEYGGQLLQCHKDDLLKYVSLISNKKLTEKIFICSSFPDIFALTAVTRLKLFNDWKLTYEIRDDMEEFNRVGYSKWYSTQLEIKVARLVDKIMTVSPRLASKIKIMSKQSDDWSKKIRVIQNAAPDNLIEKSTYLRNSSFFQQKTESKIIGYIGHLTPAWFDWTLILTAARDFPELTFEIIGHGMPETLSLPENVVYLGPKNHDEFLKISERWKIGLIPFITSPLTYGVDPNKIYEYLAANLLVVTADMGSVRECPATYVYTDYSEFKIGLESALKIEYTNELLSEIVDYVEKSRWSNRAQNMIEFIQEEI